MRYGPEMKKVDITWRGFLESFSLKLIMIPKIKNYYYNSLSFESS